MYTNTQAINIFALTAYPERHTKVWMCTQAILKFKIIYVSWLISSLVKIRDLDFELKVYKN